MGFWSSLFGGKQDTAATRRATPAQTIPLLPNRWGEIEVQGESYRRDAVRRLFVELGLPEGGVTNQIATLAPEPKNPYDRFAVKVLIGQWHIGYVPAEISAEVSAALRGSHVPAPVRVWASPSDGTWRARATLFPSRDLLERDEMGTTRAPYLSADEQAALLRLGSDGMPNLHLRQHEGEWWLAEDSTGRLVNVGSRALKTLGIWSVRVRGDEYAPGTLRVGAVDLIREPANEADPNAVAIVQDGVRCGYWNKGGARSLAKLIDGGEVLAAYAISASPPKVIAADPAVLEHVARSSRR